MSYLIAIVFLLLRRMAWTLILGINGPYRSVCHGTCLAVILIIVVETDWKWMLLQTPHWPWLSGRPAPRHRGWWTRWSRTPRPVATAHLGLPDASLPGSATTEDTKRHLWVMSTKKTHHSFIVYQLTGPALLKKVWIRYSVVWIEGPILDIRTWIKI